MSARTKNYLIIAATVLRQDELIEGILCDDIHFVAVAEVLVEAR